MAWIVRNLTSYPGPALIDQAEKCGIGDSKVTKKFAEMTTMAVQEALYPTGGGGTGPQVKTFA